MRGLKSVNKVKNAAAAAIVIVSLMLFPVKAQAQETQHELIPMGLAAGICMETDGVLVSGFAMKDGSSPASRAGIRAGDIIRSVNGEKIISADSLKSVLESCRSSDVKIQLYRGEKSVDIIVNLEESDGTLGLMVKDSVAGVGTITYYDPDTGKYGALGHGISDADTGILFPIRAGTVTQSVISATVKGSSGSPGELLGTVGGTSAETIGTIEMNTEHGIFGTFNKTASLADKKAMPAACKNDIRTGPATMLSTISGNTPTEYEVNVERVYSENGSGRDMLIKITDSRLLAATGGIVQGMSGSVLLQNNKIIGAVTHVLVNDPAQGYAISIEQMLKESDALTNKKAA